MSRKCTCCLVSELYRPGEWSVGWFRPARLQGGAKPLPIHGDLCPQCVEILDAEHNKPTAEEAKAIDKAAGVAGGVK